MELHDEGLATLLTGRTKRAKAAHAAAAKELSQLASLTKLDNGDEGKEQQRKRLHEIKKKCGNMLLLCPSLLHNFNKFNSRVLLLGGRTFWTAVIGGTEEDDAAGRARPHPAAQHWQLGGVTGGGLAMCYH